MKQIMYFYMKKHVEYLKSGPYALKQVKKVVHKNNHNNVIKTSNSWLLKLGDNRTSLQEFGKNYGTENLNEALKQINETYFKYQKTSDKNNFADLLDELI